jgi:tetratricopeptide (TPR) repeat protein
MDSETPEKGRELSEGDRIAAVGSLIKQVEKCIKDQNFEAALDLIETIRKKDGQNLYIHAYEERVRGLMRASKVADIALSARPVAPPVEEQPTLVLPRAEALHQTLENLISRAKDLFARGEHTLALEEVRRARLLAPDTPELTALENEIRAAFTAIALEREAQRKHADEETEQRRVEVLRRQLARMQREKEERRKQQTSARQSAQEGKVRDSLKTARQAIAQGMLDEARSQLRFMRILTPDHPDIHTLDAEIATADRFQKESQEALQEKQAAEVQRRKAAIDEAARRFTELATRLAGRGEFSEALRTVTRGFLLDPAHPALLECERAILRQRDEAAQHQREEEHAREELERRQQEQSLEMLAAAEQERLQEQERRDAEAEMELQRQEIAALLAEAQAAAEAGDTESALEIVARALARDPLDTAANALATSIQEKRSMALNAAHAHEESARAGQAQDASLEAVRHLERAMLAKESSDYVTALDEITLALSLDPLNDLAKTLEAEISTLILNLPAAPNALGNTIAEFKKTLDGLTGTPGAASVAPPTDPVLQEHIVQAGKLLEQHQFEDALVEVALGLMIDSEQQDLRQLEQRIWEERDRHEDTKTPGSATLRLVHQRKSANGPQ